MNYPQPASLGWGFCRFTDNEDHDNDTEDDEHSTKGKDLKDYDYDGQRPSKSVPEPFTIVGTLVGGAVALRTRNKLKAKAG